MEKRVLVKKIVTTMLIAALLITALPIGAMKVNAGGTADIRFSGKKLLLTVYQPFDGDKVSDVSVGNAEGTYYRENVWKIKETWKDSEADKTLGSGDVFKAGKKYQYSLVITAAEENTFPDKCDGVEFPKAWGCIEWESVIEQGAKVNGRRYVFSARTTAKSIAHDKGSKTVDLTSGSATFTGTEANLIYHTCNFATDNKVLEADPVSGVVFDLNDDGTGDIKGLFILKDKATAETVVIQVLDTSTMDENYVISKDGLNRETLETYGLDYYSNLTFVFVKPGSNSYNKGEYVFDFTKGSATIDMGTSDAEAFSRFLGDVIEDGKIGIDPSAGPDSTSIKMDLDLNHSYDVLMQYTGYAIKFTPLNTNSIKKSITIEMNKASWSHFEAGKENFYSKATFIFSRDNGSGAVVPQKNPQTVQTNAENPAEGKKEIIDPNMPKTRITKLEKVNNSIKVTWKMVKKSKGSKGIKGYIIEYCKNKDFIGRVKTVKIKNHRCTSKKIKILDKKKQYVRIRTFKKAESGLVYSEWSKVRRVNTKKKSK